MWCKNPNLQVFLPVCSHYLLDILLCSNVWKTQTHKAAAVSHTTSSQPIRTHVVVNMMFSQRQFGYAVISIKQTKSCCSYFDSAPQTHFSSNVKMIAKYPPIVLMFKIHTYIHIILYAVFINVNAECSHCKIRFVLSCKWTVNKLNVPGSKNFFILQFLQLRWCNQRHRNNYVIYIIGALTSQSPSWTKLCKNYFIKSVTALITKTLLLWWE